MASIRYPNNKDMAMTRKIVRCCLCVVMLGAILSTSGCERFGKIAGDALFVGAAIGLDALAGAASNSNQVHTNNQLNYYPLDHGHDYDRDLPPTPYSSASTVPTLDHGDDHDRDLR
jgi:hypothetical protein